MDNMFMHLTNYAINKHNENFTTNDEAQDDDSGHKRSLKSVFESLKKDGGDPVLLWA